MSDSAVYDALVRSPLARELESAFTEATGLPVELVPSGEPRLLFTFQGSGSPFCSLMAQFTGSCIACQKAHLELQQRMADNLAPQVSCCFAGLVEFTVPVMVGGQHVATLFGGQVFQRKPTQAQFERLGRSMASVTSRWIPTAIGSRRSWLGFTFTSLFSPHPNPWLG